MSTHSYIYATTERVSPGATKLRMRQKHVKVTYSTAVSQHGFGSAVAPSHESDETQQTRPVLSHVMFSACFVAHVDTLWLVDWPATIVLVSAKAAAVAKLSDGVKASRGVTTAITSRSHHWLTIRPSRYACWCNVWLLGGR